MTSERVTGELYRYGTLIARLMADRISEQEAQQLDEWIFDQPQNMKLFENLTNPWKWRWTRRWFREQSINTSGIKWKNLDGWHKPDKKSLRDFYIVMAVCFLFLVMVYFVLES